MASCLSRRRATVSKSSKGSQGIPSDKGYHGSGPTSIRGGGIYVADQPTRLLARRLADFYTMVEPYEFRDAYDYDLKALTSDMIENLRSEDDIMAAREWLEEVYTPDDRLGNLRMILIDELDRLAATRSPNVRPGSLSYRRHRIVR